MISPIPPLYFYIPSKEALQHVPDNIEKYWAWICDFVQKAPVKMPNEHGLCTWLGPYNWILQTFIYLKSQGVPCELTAALPDEGIIITHSDMLPIFLRPTSHQFIVELKPDRSLRCIFANFVIVQNRRDPIRSGFKRVLIKTAFVNYWLQPGLIARNSTRGDRFENICYMGNTEQFLDRVDDLAAEVEKLGLSWKMVPRNEWHDYSEVDAVVAVRQAGSSTIRAPHFVLSRKPASKLCNAWAAGVPAILSPDVAYQDLRKSELDFLEARDIPEILYRLRQLMKDVSMRRSMMKHGRIRAAEFNLEKTIQGWIQIITTQIVPSYLLWRRSHFRRNWFFLTRKLAYKIDSRLFA